MAGIGQESDGDNTEAHSAGLVIQETGSSLGNGEYVLAGHKVATNGYTTADVPSGVASRWTRVWYVDKTGTVDVTLAFDFSEGSVGGTPVDNGYRLLYSASNAFSFSDTGLSPTVGGDQAQFTVPDATLQDGYYTLARAAIIVEAGVVSIASDGQCSLREAIINANDDAVTHGDCIAGSGADIIQLAAGSTYTINDVHNTTDGANGLPSITSQITIQGNGATITRGGGAADFRLFHVAATGNLTLENLTLSNGRAVGGNGGNNGHWGGAGGGAAGLGGAIYNRGTLSLTNSTLAGNTARGGRGGATREWRAPGGGGGGVAGDGGDPPNGNQGGNGGPPNGGSGGTDGEGSNGGDGGGGGGGGYLSAPQSQGFRGGSGGFGGGGGGGSFTGADYSAGGSGGDSGFGGGGGGGGLGYFNGVGGAGGYGGGDGGGAAGATGGGGGGGLGAGGAIFNRGGNVTISNSTFSGNTAQGGDGGCTAGDQNCGSDGQGLGGGLFNRNGAVTVYNSTFAGNTAADGGGATFNLGDASTATLTLRNSILANTTSGTDCKSTTNAGGSTSLSGANNLIESNSGCPAVTVTSDPNLGALANNGGDTQTHALLGGSPAIDAGDDATCLATDQRGATRPAGAHCDIGSYEASNSITISDVTLAEGDSGATAFQFTVTRTDLYGASSVQWATADNTAAQPGDYTSASGTVNFAAGDTEETVTIQVNGDTTYESDETFYVNLSNPSNAIIVDSQGLGTITNDDWNYISINDVTLAEGDSGATAFQFTVTRQYPDGASSVQWATANGTATAGSDYTAASGTVSFGAGETSKTVTVNVNGDADYEGNETFYVNLSSPNNASIVDSQGLGTITNDDPERTGTGPGGVGTSDGTSILELWLKADAGASTTTNGQPVSSWADQSGNGNQATQSTGGKQPTYTASGANSQPTITFDGSADEFAVQNTVLTNGTNWTALLVGKKSSEDGYDTAVGFGTNGDNPLLGTNGAKMCYYHGGATNGSSNVGTTTYRILGFHKNGSTMTLLLDGATDGSRTDAPGTIGADARIGGYSGEYWAGTLSEVIVYRDALNSARRILVENYLSAKYGLTLASGDKYEGDTSGKGDYDLDVAGIGQESDGDNIEAHSAGLIIQESSSSLGNGEYVLAGHKTVTNGTTTNDVSDGLERWQRVWYVDKTGTVDVTLAFDFSEGGIGGTPGGGYRLLYSASNAFSFSDTGLNATISDDQVQFSVPNATLQDGYYTLAHLAEIVVNDTGDADDATPGDGVCETATGNGVCTLRAAVSEANALTGHDTIRLPAGTYNLTGTYLEITDDLTINGAGASTTIIDGQNNAEVFYVPTAGVSVTISGVTIQNGNGLGGSIINGGTMTLSNCMIQSNTGIGGYGGGILNAGTMTLNNCTIQSNTATDGRGGGIYNLGATMTLNNCTVSGNSANTASGSGGGIHNEGTLTLNNCMVSSNSADSGGGGINNWGTMTLTNSTVSGNTTNGSGGGIYSSGSLTVEDSTISGNTANGSGGGIYNGWYNTVTLNNSTVSSNTADHDNAGGGDGGGIYYTSSGTVNSKNSIIAGNDDKSTPGYDDCYAGGTFNSQGYNLVGSGTGCPSDGTGDQTTTDPKLGPLADNGGPSSGPGPATWTHALLSGSPAIDQIPNGANGCGTDYTSDQRGVSRPQPAGGNCDIGAFELEQANLVIVKTVDPDTVAPSDTITYTLTFSNAGNAVASGVVITDVVPVSITNTSVISSGVAITDTGASPPYVWEVADLASGEGGVITITGQLPGALPCGLTFTNTAVITTTAVDTDTPNNSSSVGVTVQNFPPIASFRTALDFDGSDDWVDCTNNGGNKQSATVLGLPQRDIALEAWVRPRSYTIYRSIVSFIQDNAGFERGWDLELRNGNKFGFTLAGTSGGSLTWMETTNSFSTDAWYHVAGVYDGTTMKIYVNGVLENTSTSESGDISYADSWLALGTYKDDDERYSFPGQIDEVRIWNVARTQAQIQANMYRRLTGSEPNLVGYWQFDEGSGSTAFDLTANGNDGTLKNMDDADWVTPSANVVFDTDEDTSVSSILAAGDPNSDTLTYGIYTDPVSGSVEITDTATGDFVYTPTNQVASYTDTFTYVVTDTCGLTDTATVSITVSADSDPPDAVDDTASTDEDTPVTVDVLSNDSDPEGAGLSVSAVGTPNYGSASTNVTTVTYAPTDRTADYTAVFTYTASDGSLTDTATVSVTVSADRDADMAIAKSVNPPTTAPGETITHTLTFTNNGPNPATGVVITDVVPVSVTNASVISSGVTITDTGASPPYVWDVDDLASGAGGVITITGQLSGTLAAGTFTNTAVITTTAVDGNPLNNQAQAGVTVVAPEMDVQGKGISIADGDATPSTTDDTDFGSADVTTGQVDHTFTIQNTGSAALNLTGTPKVVIAGAHAGDFTVTADPTSPVVSGGGTTTFTVGFDPSAIGVRTATLSIDNNDGYENPYDFAIQGTGAETVETATGGTAEFTSYKGVIEDLAAVAEETLPTAGKPDLDFPYGFFSFRFTGLAAGETVVLTITLPSAVPAGTQYWKYHEPEGWIQIPMGSDDGDNVITITLVDGGLGDDDGLPNGVIVDPGGPGQLPQFTLTVNKAGTGTVTSEPAGINCGADCTENYDEDTDVTLTATPDAGSGFVGWSGDCSGTGLTIQVTMDADKTCTATFETHTLTVNTTGDGTGRVTSEPAGINCGGDCTEVYAAGTVVTLTAHPGVKSYLTSWGGDCDADGQVTMDSDKTCTATFGYPVGGIVVPVDKLGLLVPWMGLVALAGLAALGVALVRRRGG